MQGAVFGVAGGEAIDLAIKLARGHTGRREIVSYRGGYHGHTGLALATGDAPYREAFGPNLPGFTQIPFNDLGAVEEAVDERTAAVLIESIPATLGFPMPDPGYLEAIETRCRQVGALLVVDEVQTGLGRTGSVWYYEREGISPDMVVTAKGLGGGIYPIAATLVTAELLEFFRANPFIHISTFGGAELGCVAALEVLDIVEEPGFLERVDRARRLVRAGARRPPVRAAAARADDGLRLRRAGRRLRGDAGFDRRGRVRGRRQQRSRRAPVQAAPDHLRRGGGADRRRGQAGARDDRGRRARRPARGGRGGARAGGRGSADRDRLGRDLARRRLAGGAAARWSPSACRGFPTGPPSSATGS